MRLMPEAWKRLSASVSGRLSAIPMSGPLRNLVILVSGTAAPACDGIASTARTASVERRAITYVSSGTS